MGHSFMGGDVIVWIKISSMTKQDKIQAAYGEHWQSIKDRVDENGWLNLGWNNSDEEAMQEALGDWGLKAEDGDTRNSDISYGEGIDFWRPEILRGIDDNNGWIKLESESDLPKTIGKYWVIRRNVNGIEEGFYYAPEAERWLGIITHYQPIIKPKLPIY